MNVEKFLIILFVLITFLLMSVGGVFAEEIVNESVTDTSLDDALSSQAVLTDDSLYANQNDEIDALLCFLFHRHSCIQKKITQHGVGWLNLHTGSPRSPSPPIGQHTIS